MHMFIYMWGIAKIRVSVGQSAHDLFSKRLVSCRLHCRPGACKLRDFWWCFEFIFPGDDVVQHVGEREEFEVTGVAKEGLRIPLTSGRSIVR